LHPEVDCGALLPNASPHHRAAALRQVRRALVDADAPGYFVASNLQEVFPEEYMKRIYRFANLLHALPVEEKLKFDRRSGEAGVHYSGPDVGLPELNYDPTTYKSSTAHAWEYCAVRAMPGRGVVASAVHEANATLPALTESWHFANEMRELYRRQDMVGEALLMAFAEALDLPSNTFVDLFAGGDLGTIRLIRYPGDQDAGASDTIGIAPHTDFECFTLMHQDATGLQLMRKGTKGPDWRDAPDSLGNFTVIIGDILERYTNGVLRATPHRVLPSAHPRMSIIRFCAVHPDAVVEPLPPFVTSGRPSAYTKVTMHQHMKTTLDNLDKGLGSWDPARNVSLTATYKYT